jgi:hypothetical protein
MGHETFVAVKTFIRQGSTPSRKKRNFGALNNQDKNSFESSENKGLFASHEVNVHENHRNYGNCFEKITGQSSCKSVGSMIE